MVFTFFCNFGRTIDSTCCYFWFLEFATMSVYFFSFFHFLFIVFMFIFNSSQNLPLSVNTCMLDLFYVGISSQMVLKQNVIIIHINKRVEIVRLITLTRPIVLAMDLRGILPSREISACKNRLYMEHNTPIEVFEGPSSMQNHKSCRQVKCDDGVSMLICFPAHVESLRTKLTSVHR